MGENFGLIATNRRMVPHYREIVARYGLERRCGGIEAIDFSNIRALNDVFASKETGVDCLKQILDAARRLIARDVEVVIPTGPLTALLRLHDVNQMDGVPLLDCQSLLVKMGELMVKMKKLTGVHVSRRLLYEAPSAEFISHVGSVRGLRI